jgi:hypothetical protein
LYKMVGQWSAEGQQWPKRKKNFARRGRENSVCNDERSNVSKRGLHRIFASKISLLVD